MLADCFIRECYLLIGDFVVTHHFILKVHHMCYNRYGCVEEILTIAAMLSVDNAIFYHPRVSNVIMIVWMLL